MLYSWRSFRHDSFIVKAPRIGDTGKREFEFTTRALRSTSYLSVLKQGVCALCFSVSALGASVGAIAISSQ